MTDLPLAFALGRCPRMAMRAQQTDNRREYVTVKIVDLYVKETYNITVNDDVKVIILRVDRGAGKPSADTDLFGRTLEQWVCSAMRGLATERVPYREGEDILPVVKEHLDPLRAVTVVLYSDTPLITYSAVIDSVRRLKRDETNVLRLPRGWVLRTEYVRTTEKIYTDRIITPGDDDFVTVFNYNQLSYAAEILRSRITYFFMDHGVEIVDPNTTFIGVDAVIEEGAKICPFTTIRGKSIIRSGAVIKEHCVIDSSVVESGAVITASTLTGALVYRNATVGPYAHLRTGAIVGVGARIGDYVEIKNSRVGAGSKISHLAYVGDAEIGENCNIGAGVVFANYDGAAKKKITLGDKVFVGSNSTLVAPLDIGSGAFVAAGSVITESVPPGALTIGRARQTTREHWEHNAYTSTKSGDDATHDDNN